MTKLTEQTARLIELRNMLTTISIESIEVLSVPKKETRIEFTKMKKEQLKKKARSMPGMDEEMKMLSKESKRTRKEQTNIHTTKGTSESYTMLKNERIRIITILPIMNSVTRQNIIAKRRLLRIQLKNSSMTITISLLIVR